MLNVLRWLTLCAITMLFLAAFIGGGLFLFALEEEPLVRSSASADYTTVSEGKAFVKRIKMQVESAGSEGTTLVVTGAELDRLAQIGSHTFPWLKTEFDIDDSAINTRVTVQLPENPFGAYLNLAAKVGQSSEGIGIDQVGIGPLSFSGRWLLPLAARLADVLVQERQASLLLEGVSGIQVADDTILLSIAPPPDARAHFTQAVRTLQAYRRPDGEEQRVTHYYNLLAAESVHGGGRSQSLSVYLSPLMGEAHRRSENGSAVTENRAAISALVIYFSNGGFESLIGKLVSSQRELVSSPYGTTLAGRGDLMEHFLSSAAITLASQQGISLAVGEFKELLDSGEGGSGFSFVDLAADRAGIAFVTLATASESQARDLQEQVMAYASEVTFFPDTSGLVEGLSDEQFRAQYGEVQSLRYRQQVELIDLRIAQVLNGK